MTLCFCITNKKFSLRTGDSVEGEIRSPKQGERYFAIIKINKINGQDIDQVKNRVNFEDLTRFILILDLN